MPHSQRIEHKGTITAVTNGQVLVEIINRSACAGCRAKNMCSLSDQKEKKIAVPLLPEQHWSIGEEVTVSLQRSLGFKAVFFMYVLPLLALLAVLFTFPYLGASELYTGLSALAAPAVCYFMVWLFRRRIEKAYIFVLEKNHSA